MSMLSVEEPIWCPAEAASAFIEPALRAICEGDVLTLRVPLEPTVPGRGFMLEHDVRFRIAHSRDASGLNDLVAITWDPDSAIPMPEFRGTITADWNADGTGFILEIEGEYDPPGVLAGKSFDALVGSRIARTTMHDLLRRTARAIEALYQQAVSAGTTMSEERP
jgi:hypothetical protein